MDKNKEAKLAALAKLGGQTASLPYQTNLSPNDELAFQNWSIDNNVPVDSSPKSDYDMRGFFDAMQKGDPRAVTAVNQNDGRLHFTDTFKTPSHKSFSNESVYADDKAPHWDGNRMVNPQGDTTFLELPESKKKPSY